MTNANDTLTPIFSALADPTRRAIFDALLVQPSSVGDLASTQTVSRPAVSQHLKVLELAGLATVEPRGSHRIYSARKDALADLRSYLDGVWDESLRAYAAEITKLNKSR